MKKYKIKTKGKRQKDVCDALWNKIIKLRAKKRSELSGLEGMIAAHHICGKSTYALRYSLDNGICLLNRSEHIYGIHSNDPMVVERFTARIKALRGQDIYERLEPLKWNVGGTDLGFVDIYLRQELKKLEGK
ncbi:MAG: hypothetical protein U9O94_01255 [Nanoarchaeota archaeon]|nr:hypothetical protein [Nanoarchaeota archaeon]